MYKYPNGDTYFGDWEEDAFHGNGKLSINLGTYAFNSGDVYEGQLNQNSKEGKGTWYYANGSYYSGDWIKDQKNGYGLFESSQSEEKY